MQATERLNCTLSMIKYHASDKINHKELVNISIRGEPGTGKSVVALTLFDETNTLLEKKYKKNIDRYHNIASDQNEFLRLSKDDEQNICVEIDEISAMSNTGANASTEAAEFQFYSDLCRVLYKHRIACSPINVLDTNAFVILDIMGKDEENQRTQVMIIYRNLLDGNYTRLGSAWIDVSETLKQKWYKRYEKKKLMRIELMIKHGIRDIRELEFAQVALAVIKDLEPIIMTGERIDLLPTIKMRIMLEMQRRYKRPISYVAEDEMIKPITAVLGGRAAWRKAGKSNTNKGVESQAQKILRETYEALIINLKMKVNILDKYQNIE